MSISGRIAKVPSSVWRNSFIALLAVVVAVSGVQQFQKANKLSRLNTQTKTAFLRWRVQILGDETPGRGPLPGFKKGDDVYQIYSYPNPPIMPLILWPLAELPAIVGAMLWFALKVGMAATCFLWAFRLAGPMPGWAKGLAILMSLHPILGDLSHGNVNIFTAFLVLGSLEHYRRGWNVLAGVALALAIACKVTPALIVGYFVWKAFAFALPQRHCSNPMIASARGPLLVIVGVAVGLGLWLFVVPGAVLGWDHNRTLLNSWYERMAKPFLIDGKITSEHANQSIPGCTVRMLTSQPSVVGYDENDQPYGEEYHNVADIGPENAKWIVRLFQAAFVLLVAGFAWSQRRDGLWAGAEMAFVLIGMLLFSERTWKHHGVVLLLPYAVLFGFAAKPNGGIARWVVGAILGIAAVLTLGSGALPEEAQDVAMTYGAYTAAFLLLAAGTVAVMSRGRSITPN